MIQIVAVLTIRDISLFKQYESQAIQIMQKYGGRLISAFRTKEKEEGVCREVHILSFPNEQQFDVHKDCNPAIW